MKKFTPIFKTLCIIFALFILTSCAKNAEIIEIDDKPTVIPDEIKTQDENTSENETTSLNLGMLKPNGSLHPLYINNEVLEDALSLVFEPAIKLDSSDNPLPSIIESWEVDSKGKQYVFHIRKNVHFHGSESCVKSSDIIYALDEIMEADEASCRWSGYKACVDAYEATDDYTFKMRLKSASKNIFYLLSFPVFSKNTYAPIPSMTLKTPEGTGGYKVSSFDASTGFTLAKNPEWWRVEGNIEDITVKYFANSSELLNAYRNGDIDTFIDTDMTFSLSSGSKSQEYFSLTQYYDCLIPNCRAYPTNIKEVRQGISYMLDRSEIVKQAACGNGAITATPLRLDKWYNSKIDTNISKNRDKALSAFAAAGFLPDSGKKITANGIPLMFNVIYYEAEDSTYRTNLAAILTTQFAEEGITLECEKLSKDEFLSRIEAGSYDLALCSFYTKSNDDLSVFFGDNSTLNYGYYDGQSIDELIAKANGAVGEEDIKTAYSELYDYLYENLPQIGLYYRMHGVVLPSGVKNVGLMRSRSVFADINTWKSEN